MDTQGLYDPQHEHDACGVGFVVDIKGRQTHGIVQQALRVLKICNTAVPAGARSTPVTAPES